jgi:PAS domain S-box-containing protein
LGKPLDQVFPPAIVRCTDLLWNLKVVMQTGEPFSGGELEYRSPGLGSRVYFYCLIPLKKERDSLASVALYMDDVTEKKNLGERVNRAERHLASVVESANDLIVSLEPDGAVITWNGAAERVLGFSLGDVVTKPLTSTVIEAYRPRFQAVLDELTREGKVQEVETEMQTADGQKRLISWRLSAMRENQGKVVALVGVGRDLTEKRQLELKLVQSAKMAALGEMAGGIAHEIRNPLAIISAAAQLILKKGNAGELVRECAEKIRSAASRAAVIIETLLRFARPSEELVELVDVNSAITEALALVGHQVSLQSIEIGKQLTSALPRVKGNSNQLQQVFINIILNAYHAMPRGGLFTIETRPATVSRELWVEIRFADTGCGISEEDCGRIFDPFFTRMPVGKGTGLGLTIAYSIVRMHGGVIRVESELAKGSTFTVALPAERADD